MTTYVRRRPVPARAPHRGLTAVGLLALVALTACDFPTEAPILRPRFIVPAETFTLSVSELLPNTVQIAGSAFTLSINPGQPAVLRLSSACPACPNSPLIPVPKPAFTADLPPATVALPQNVVGASVTSGRIILSINNQFDFDPIQPSGATSPGSLAIRITSGTTVLADISYTGPLPPNSTTPVTINLQPGAVTQTNGIRADLRLTSPAGSPTTVNTADEIRVTPSAQAITISQATLNTANESITETEVLDLTDIDETISEHVEEGALLLTITRPAGQFVGVTGTVSLTIEGVEPLNGSTTITKPNVINLASTTQQRVAFTREDLRRMFGHEVTMRITGNVSLANTVVRPTDALSIASKLDVTITTESK